jgi:hypothetical protein
LFEDNCRVSNPLGNVGSDVNRLPVRFKVLRLLGKYDIEVSLLLTQTNVVKFEHPDTYNEDKAAVEVPS